MSTHDDDLAHLLALADSRSTPPPLARLAWTALIDIDQRESLGAGPQGERFIVPIRGGRFWGGPGFETLRGSVRPGGADRQLLRRDGVKELHALYEMAIDDGSVLTVDNRVLIDDTVTPERYAISHLSVHAPAGSHHWLNRRIFVGTLKTLRPERETVVVRAYLMGT